MRGPGVVPAVPGRPMTRTRAERFDALVLALVAELEERWSDRLGLVEYGAEDAPMVPDDWDLAEGAPGVRGTGRASGAPVPLSSLVRAQGDRPTRLVLFRRPIEHRCHGRDELEALVHAVLVEQVAELLGLDPEQVDPRYGPDEP